MIFVGRLKKVVILTKVCVWCKLKVEKVPAFKEGECPKNEEHSDKHHIFRSPERVEEWHKTWKQIKYRKDKTQYN